MQVRRIRQRRFGSITMPDVYLLNNSAGDILGRIAPLA
jgi:hypothetical protein